MYLSFSETTDKEDQKSICAIASAKSKIFSELDKTLNLRFSKILFSIFFTFSVAFEIAPSKLLNSIVVNLDTFAVVCL